MTDTDDLCLRHPEIPQEAQVALALRTLCGFNVAEIASAFLTSEAAIAKRLTRAKQRIRAARISFEIPAGPELTARLNGVLQTLCFSMRATRLRAEID